MGILDLMAGLLFEHALNVARASASAWDAPIVQFELTHAAERVARGARAPSGSILIK